MRRIILPAAIVLAALTTPSRPAKAQTPANAEQEVLAVVNKLFDAMRSRDTAAMRSVFDTSAKLVTTSTRNGQPSIRSTKIADFISIIGGAPAADTLNESIYDTEVRVDDNLATVWTAYDFRVNSRFSHCGYDAFQMVRTPEGWKIIAIADTQKREGCKNAN